MAASSRRQLSTSILDGITRRSVLQLARDWDLPVEERKVSIARLWRRRPTARLQEAFGVGTAATIAPIATIGYRGQDYNLPAPAAQLPSPSACLQALDAIRTGRERRHARLDGERVDLHYLILQLFSKAVSLVSG